MKKNETILKTVFLFLFSLFLLQSCRNETVIDSTQENSAHKSKTLATLKEVLEATSLKTSKDVMARSTSISSLYNPNEYEMDTLTIRKTFNDNETTEYAIALKKKNETEKGVFYNLVFTKKDNKWKKFLIKLTPEYYKDTELITRHRIEIISSESSKKGMKSASCSTEYFTLTVFDCPAGHNNPFDGDCSGCWKTIGSGFSYNCDQESINRDFNIGGDSVGGGGGGGVGVNPYELSAPLALNFYLQSKGGVLLSSEETAFLNSNVSLANSLKYYFLNNENENSPAFFHWTMSFFMQNPNTSWSQFQNWFINTDGTSNLSFDSNITSSNSKLFNTLTDLKNAIETKNNIVTTENSVLQDNGSEKIVSAKVKRTGIWNSGEEIIIKLKKVNNLWAFDNVSSSEYGLTLGTWSFTQIGYTQNTSNPILTVEVTGYENYNIFVEGIGTIYKDKVMIRVKINNTTGNIVGIEFIDL